MTIEEALAQIKGRLERMIISYAEQNTIPPRDVLELYHYVR